MQIPGLEGVVITWRDILDVALVTLLFYQVIMLIRGTRATAALLGLLGLMLAHFVAGQLGLSTLNWILETFLSSLFLVVVIVFQRDIRLALTAMGGKRLFFWRNRPAVMSAVEDVVGAALYMAQRKIGALIVIERGVPLGDVTERGVTLDARVSKELLIALFWPKSPLHDGAVIIRDNRVVAGGCILPLSAIVQGKQDYGTRHRAALGITEETDAVTVVVSEERGAVSVALGGRLTTALDAMRLRRTLSSALERTL